MTYHPLDNRQPGSDRSSDSQSRRPQARNENGSGKSSDPQSHRSQAGSQNASDKRGLGKSIESQSLHSRSNQRDGSGNPIEPLLNRPQAGSQDGSEKPGSDKINPALSRLFRTAESIHQTTQTLLDSVERQIEAIKTADLVRLEELTDTYASTLSQFREEEDQLIHEIGRAAAWAKEGQADKVGLSDSQTSSTRSLQGDDPLAGSLRSERGGASNQTIHSGNDGHSRRVDEPAKAGESANASESLNPAEPAKADGQVVRLRDLSALYPASAKMLDNWRNTLEQGVRSLSLKQEQLTRLLEFAVDQNSQLLSTVYQIINRDSSHYGPDGKASAVKPGSTVNHKA